MSKKLDKPQESWFRQMSYIFALMTVFLIPLGMRLQWVTPWTYFKGHFSDYAAYFFYASDICLVMTILFWKIDLMKQFWRKGDWDDWKINVWQALVVVIFAGIVFWDFYSIVWAFNREIALYKAIRWLEVYALFGYLVLGVKDNWDKWKKLLWVFVGGVFLQAVWGIGQYIVQHDFGWQKLGENILTRDGLGVAKIIIDGEKYIRAYGSLPHANVFAWMMILGLIAIIANYQLLITNLGIKNNNLKIEKEGNIFGYSIKKWLIGGLFLGLVLNGFLVSWSRSAWIAGIILVMGLGMRFLITNYLSIRQVSKLLRRGKNNKDVKEKDNLSRIIVVGFLILLVGVVFNYKGLISRGNLDLSNDISWEVRGQYDAWAEQMIDKSYYFGYGLGNYVIVLPYFAGSNMQWWQLQPVHNVFKLAWAELGVAGWILLVLLFTGLYGLVYFARSQWKWWWLGVVTAVLFLMFYDHYMWDVWQGQLGFGWLLALLVVFGGKEKISNY